MPLVNIESTPRQLSRRRMQGHGTSSTLDFEKWGNEPFSPQVVDQELQTQKKRMYKVTPPYNISPVEVPHPPMIPPADELRHEISTCI